MPGPAAQPTNLDHYARQLGFPDYATWAAWNAHRTAALQNSHTTQRAGPVVAPAAPSAPPENVFQYLMRKWSGAVK